MSTMNSWGNTISNAAVTLNGGAVNIGSDNAANAINIGVGTTARTVGICNSAAAHVLTVGSSNGAAGTTLQYGTNGLSVTGGSGGQAIFVASAGQVTKPLQPVFAAKKTSNTTNVTGDGTAYTIIFDTKFFDIGTNYNSGTGVFTAPVTGKYYFYVVAMGTGIVAQTTGQMRLITSSFNFNGNYQSPTTTTAAGGNLSLMCSAIISMSSGDTIHADAVYSGSTKTVGINGNSSDIYTGFYGYLIG